MSDRLTDQQRIAFDRCPVKGTRGTGSREGFGSSMFNRCEITVERQFCKVCDTRLYREAQVTCVLEWFVCKACYPRECVAYSQPENENPTIGEVRFV